MFHEWGPGPIPESARDRFVGGLVGKNNGEILECGSEVSLAGDVSAVGGLAGGNVGDGRIVESYSKSDLSGDLFSVGGLVGGNDGELDPDAEVGLVISFAENLKEDILQRFHRDEADKMDKRFSEFVLIEAVRMLLDLSPSIFYEYLRQKKESK